MLREIQTATNLFVGSCRKPRIVLPSYQFFKDGLTCLWMPYEFRVSLGDVPITNTGIKVSAFGRSVNVPKESDSDNVPPSWIFALRVTPLDLNKLETCGLRRITR